MKTTPQNQLLLDKIYRVCCRINNDTDMCAFFWLSGHVGKVNIRVAESKDTFQVMLLYMDAWYQHSFITDEEIAECLTIVLNRLCGLLLNLSPVTDTITDEAQA